MSVKKLKSEFHAAISSRDFAPAADFVTDHAVPCLRFRDLGSFDKAPIGATRFGGDPDLPPNLPWPVDPEGPTGKNALLFLAQFDCEELPLWDGCVLPTSGLLSVFAGIGGLQGFSTALYFPKNQVLDRRQTPLAELGPVFHEECYLKPCRAEPVLALSIPASAEHFQRKVIELCSDLDWLDPDYPEIDDDLKGFEEQSGPDDWFSQMLGYAVPPHLTHNHYHEKAAAAHLEINAINKRRVFDLDELSSDERELVEKESLRFPLLLSMRSAGSTGAMWSDCGTLFALAQEDQIRSCDFTRLPTFVYH